MFASKDDEINQLKRNRAHNKIWIKHKVCSSARKSKHFILNKRLMMCSNGKIRDENVRKRNGIFTNYWNKRRSFQRKLLHFKKHLLRNVMKNVNGKHSSIHMLHIALSLLQNPCFNSHSRHHFQQSHVERNGFLAVGWFDWLTVAKFKIVPFIRVEYEMCDSVSFNSCIVIA